MKQFLCILFFYGTICADEKPVFLKQNSYMMGYFGELLTHPGLQVGAEQTFFKKRMSLHLRESLFFYRHKRNHDGLGVHITLPLKIPTNRRFSGEISGGVGYLLKMTNSEKVFSLSEFGTIRESARFTMHRFLLSTSVGINAYIIQRDKFSLGTYLHPTLFWEYPYNDSFLLHGAIACGITVQINREAAL